MNCKVKVLKHLEGVYAYLQPQVGMIYVAQLCPGATSSKDIAVITINNKLVALRKGEFERVE